MTGGIVFIGAAVVVGQIASESRVAPVPSRLAPRALARRLTNAEAPRYTPVAKTDREVQSAIQFALSDQRKKNRSALKLLSVISAERQVSSGANVRLCLGIDRHGRADSARAVVHRSENNLWLVTLWAWDACK